jgi:Bacterial regulatory proteins, tetR family.
VSSNNSKARILDVALALIKKRKGADVSMAEIANSAKVSRQAMYFISPIGRI